MDNELSKGFTGIEINGIRFSNIREMLIYMDKQRDQLTKAKEIINEFVELKNKPCAAGHSVNMLLYDNICVKAEQFLK